MIEKIWEVGHMVDSTVEPPLLEYSIEILFNDGSRKSIMGVNVNSVKIEALEVILKHYKTSI